MHVLIVLEGLEGVGKTSLGSVAAPLLPAAYVKTPPPEFDDVRSFVAKLGDPAVNFHFYLSGLLAIQSRLRGHDHVLVDRYLPSTIAYHDSGRSFVPPAFDVGLLAVPDLIVNVTCPPAKRALRVAGRGHHIYVRPSVDEPAIEAYFAKVADVEFVNDAPFEASVDALVRLIRDRLR